MRTPDRLPDEALDSLLDGSPSPEAVGTPLAAYLDAVRHDAVTTDPQPSDELGVVLAEGLDPAEIEVGVQAAAAAGGITAWRRRGRLALRALVTKFAALGLVTKAAAAGAAVTVAASGAGAAGVLPPPAQSTFNEVIGREAPPEDAGVEDDETGETGESTPDTPADTSSTAPLDSDLSDDATDGDPGVDGSGVARDASDGRSDVSDDPPARTGDVPEEPPAEDAPDGTPAEDIVEDTPGGDAPPDSDEADDGQDAADNGEVDQRPDEPTRSPDVYRPPR